MRVLIKTFGCKVNFADGEEVAASFASDGWECAHAEEDEALAFKGAPELIIVNTCAVTHTAVAKARHYIRRVSRGYPKARIIVTGCCGRNEAIAAELKAIGAEVAEIGDLHREKHKADTARFHSSRSRRFIKVQDGCDCFCAYCIVPYVRKRWDAQVSQVLTQVQRALDDNISEIIICGVNLGLYREPNTGGVLSWLIAEIISALPEQSRLRLSSIEPEHVTPELISLFANPKLCSHLHLPMQSGSQNVLNTMRRRCSKQCFEAAAGMFRQAAPAGSLTTDIMVGYPTETEADFAETCDAVVRLSFERAHVFRFSPRPGTAAEKLKLLPSSVVTRREKELSRLCAEVAEARWRRFLGGACTIALERGGEGYGESYQRVKLVNPEKAGKGLVKVRLLAYANGAFTGEAL